jgi:Arc/MetJ-type ribon-helix-helix transcriptional regulator
MALTIHLPQHIQDYIDRQVAEGRFASQEAVIANAVEQVMDDAWRWDEDEELLAAIAEYERDGGTVVTDFGEYLQRLSREARDESRTDLEVSDDVKY